MVRRIAYFPFYREVEAGTVGILVVAQVSRAEAQGIVLPAYNTAEQGVFGREWPAREDSNL